MKIDIITKVHFPHLDDSRSDRRGIIAHFDLRDIPNKEYAIMQARWLAQVLIMPLSEDYINRVPQHEMKFNEVMECWIFDSDDCQSIRIQHKYWSQKQIDCFRSMVRALATLHNWEIEE